MSAGNRPLRILCWEGYDAPSIMDPYVVRERVVFQVQTLLSDEATAQRMAQGDPPNWDMQCDKGWHVTVF